MSTITDRATLKALQDIAASLRKIAGLPADRSVTDTEPTRIQEDHV